MSTPLQPAERAYSLSTRPGWEQFVTAPPRQRPDRSTGHFASRMTLIARGCSRAVRTGTEKLTRDLLDQVRNDAAAEAARQELLAAFDAGKLSARPLAAARAKALAAG
jgi:hypothetical protein